MAKRYAVIGDIIAERSEGTTHPAGAAAVALALRHLGGEVTLRSRIGNDDIGAATLQQIKSARIHPKTIDVVDGITCAQDLSSEGGVSDWTQGVLMTKDGVIDIYALFGHDAVVVDLLDQPLRQFIIDLPAHTDGMVRMLTTLSHLDHVAPASDELEIAMRCDTIVGTQDQYAILTGFPTASEALGEIFSRMPYAHLRAAIAITPDGIECVARDARVIRPIQDAIPSLLLPQVAAGIAWGMAHHAEWDEMLTAAIDPEAVI